MRDRFLLDPDVCFLNHGSFGACPEPVFAEYQRLQRELEREPVEFLGRRHEALLAAARAPLAAFVGAEPDDLVYVRNATTGINVAARSLPLAPGDEVLATDLEYGACDLTWEHWCGRAGARYVRRPVDLADPVGSLLGGVGERTRALYLSHVTSQTALVLPVAEICAHARELGVPTIVDGAHAPGHVPLDLASLGADVYSANAHKWLCAPKGSGFLWASRDWQERLESPIVSWGWEGEHDFQSRNGWQGTSDPAAYLATPAAVAFVEEHDDPGRSHALAWEAGSALADLLGTEPVAPSEDYVGRMVAVPLPPGVDGDEVQRRLLAEHRVEIPVGDGILRGSFAMYNDRGDLERLLAALSRVLGR